jgi:hypothetical protein
MSIKPLFFRGYSPLFGHSFPRRAFDSLTGSPLFIDIKMVSANLTASMSASVSEARDPYGDIVWPAGSHIHVANFSLPRLAYSTFNTAGAIDERTTNIGWSETQSAQCYLFSRITISSLYRPSSSGYWSPYEFQLVIDFFAALNIGSSTWRFNGYFAPKTFWPADYLTPWTTFSATSPTSFTSWGITVTILSSIITPLQGSS